MVQTPMGKQEDLSPGAKCLEVIWDGEDPDELPTIDSQRYSVNRHIDERKVSVENVFHGDSLGIYESMYCSSGSLIAAKRILSATSSGGSMGKDPDGRSNWVLLFPRVFA